MQSLTLPGKECYNGSNKTKGKKKMQISSRFTIAVHMFVCIDTFEKERKITSSFLADSVNTNPVIIRKLLIQLKAAGLVHVRRGHGGIEIARPLDAITLLDIYRAVECVENGQLFHFHEDPNPKCPVGNNIHNVLDEKLERIQLAMEEEMAKYTLADVVKDLHKFIPQDD